MQMTLLQHDVRFPRVTLEDVLRITREAEEKRRARRWNDEPEVRELGHKPLTAEQDFHLYP